MAFFIYICDTVHSFFSISLVFLFLIKGLVPGMSLRCELQKLPNLLAHYEHHKACNDGSFWKFLVNDYLNNQGDAKDHAASEHEDLPFQGNHQCCHASTFYANMQYFSLLVLHFDAQESPEYFSISFSSLFPDTLFQPPQA